MSNLTTLLSSNRFAFLPCTELQKHSNFHIIRLYFQQLGEFNL